MWQKSAFAIPFLSENVMVFTYCNQRGIKREQYLLVSMQWMWLMEFSPDLSQMLAAFIFLREIFSQW